MKKKTTPSKKLITSIPLNRNLPMCLFKVLVIILSLQLSGCISDDGNESQPLVSLAVFSTSIVNNITNNSAEGGATISSDGGSEIITRGFCWSKASTPIIDDNSIAEGSGVGTFSAIMTSLDPNTSYYCRPYAINKAGVAYGKEVTFKTIQLTPADKIAGTYEGTGKLMPNGISLGIFKGCITPEGWEKNFRTGVALVKVSKTGDTTVDMTISSESFAKAVFTDITVTENSGEIKFGTGTFDTQTKILTFSINTGSWIITNACLQGLPYFYGWDGVQTGNYSYSTIGHINFQGTRK